MGAQQTLVFDDELAFLDRLLSLGEQLLQFRVVELVQFADGGGEVARADEHRVDAGHAALQAGTHLLGEHLILMGPEGHITLETGIAAAYEDAGRTMACNMMDESALEGVQAFIDKRKPNWHGA